MGVLCVYTFNDVTLTTWWNVLVPMVTFPVNTWLRCWLSKQYSVSLVTNLKNSCVFSNFFNNLPHVGFQL